MDEWEKYARAIEGANGLNSGNIYQNYANAGVIDASGAKSTGKKAAIQASIDETRRREGIEAANKRKAIEEQREADKTDPSKAYMKLGDDGKYRYYNGNGEALNINQFSLLTGKRPDEILADSENPADQKFVSDYQTMKQFANAWVNGDNETLKKFREADPEKYNQLISTYKSPAEMVAGFRNYYSDYYGNTEDKQTDAAKFSLSSVAGVGDDPRGKALKGALAGSDLKTTLTPIDMNIPKEPDFWGKTKDTAGTWGPLALVGGGSLWGKSEEQKKWEEYQERLKNNPWYQYNSYLTGPR